MAKPKQTSKPTKATQPRSQSASPQSVGGSADDLDQVVTHNSPITFDLWLNRPFISYATTFSLLMATGKQFDDSIRFFELNEKEIQKLALGSKEASKKGNPHQKTRLRSDRESLIRKLRTDGSFSEVFRRCSKGDGAMMAALGNQVIRHCEHLFLLAEKGNVLAVKYLAELAIKSTKGLEWVVASHTEDLRGLAAIEYAWPVMMSPVSSLSSAFPNWGSLGLGAALNLDLKQNRKVELNTPTGRLAWKLLNYVANLRHICVMQGFMGGEAIHSKRSIEQQAAALPEWSNNSSSIQQWWKVAEHCLIASFPSPKDNTKVDENHAVFAGIIMAERDRNNPGRHRSRIVDRLSEKFYSIAGFKRISTES